MKNHVYRPAIVVLVVIGLILTARYFYVPDDFGVHDRGFMYGYYRLGNEDDWKAVKVKFKTKEYCRECHPERYEANMGSKHKLIQCENCHGLAVDHPEDPPKLAVDRSRGLCLRCHTALVYPTSQRGTMKGIDPDTHNPGAECSSCHDPHKPDMEGWQ